MEQVQEVKQKGKIYKICDLNDTVRYIGSTCEKYLSNRFGGHKKAYKRWKAGKENRVRSYDIFEKYGIENCQIVLIEEFDFISREHLKAKEAEFIKTVDCVNKNMPTRTKAQWIKEHPNYQREYYEKHKEQNLISQNCPCGGVFCVFTKKQHNKSIRHQKYEKSLTSPAPQNA